MVDDKLKFLRGTERRAFLKWTGVAAALLGLDRARYLDVLSGSAGVALADEAACARVARSVHLVGGTGGLPWFTQLFPYPAIARAGNPNFAYYDTPPNVKDAATDKPSVYGPFSPLQKRGRLEQMTLFIAGANQTHTDTPTTGLTLGTNGLLAAVAAIQSTTTSLLPVIAVSPSVYGTAPGAPARATVAQSSGLVELFNSSASKSLLRAGENANLATSYHRTFLKLNAAANKDTTKRSYDTGRVAMNLLGKNFGAQLGVTPADEARYGIDAGTRTIVKNLAHGLIVGVKAFSLGLTNSLILPAMTGDDPHGGFQNMNTMRQTVQALGRILDAFFDDAASLPDPSCQTGKKLLDNLVFTISGDTPKNARSANARNDWTDDSNGNHNVLYVYGSGYLKTGWFGELTAGGTVNTWDPNTGSNVPQGAPGAMNSAQLGSPAAAAVALAVARGDVRRVQDFGVTVPMGVVDKSKVQM